MVVLCVRREDIEHNVWQVVKCHLFHIIYEQRKENQPVNIKNFPFKTEQKLFLLSIYLLEDFIISTDLYMFSLYNYKLLINRNDIVY